MRALLDLHLFSVLGLLLLDVELSLVHLLFLDIKLLHLLLEIIDLVINGSRVEDVLSGILQGLCSLLDLVRLR